MGATQRRKGAEGERELAKLLSTLWRVPNVRRAQQSDGAVCGDVVGALPPQWVVECKRHAKPFAKMPEVGGYSVWQGRCLVTTPLERLLFETGTERWNAPKQLLDWCDKADSDQQELVTSLSCWLRIGTGGWIVCHRADNERWMLTTTWANYVALKALLKAHWENQA